MPRVNLMHSYPKVNRDSVINRSSTLSSVEIKIAKEFGREYFDGDRKFGLGGYKYNPKFFKPVVRDIIKYYQLSKGSSVLDVGCGKGFMLHDFLEEIPELEIAGLDISSYCLENSMKSVADRLVLGNCNALPWGDKSFDVVISIATIHNLDLDGVRLSLQEIMRVARKGAFIKVNGYASEEEKQRLLGWNLVAETILSVDDWIELFKETGYVYDYDFFVP